VNCSAAPVRSFAPDKEAEALKQGRFSVGAGAVLDHELPKELICVYLGKYFFAGENAPAAVHGYHEVARAAKFRCLGGVGCKPGEEVRWACTGTCGVSQTMFCTCHGGWGSEAGDTFSWNWI
jgi:hypothetical protein